MDVVGSPNSFVYWMTSTGSIHSFLLQSMTAKTAEDRLRYSKQYAPIILQLDTPKELLQLLPNKRIHIMKALSSLAKVTGRSDVWHEIVQRYQLGWPILSSALLRASTVVGVKYDITHLNCIDANFKDAIIDNER